MAARKKRPDPTPKPVTGFTQIANSLISDRSINDHEFRLLVALESFDWEKTGCFPGNEGLSVRCGWYNRDCGKPALSKLGLYLRSLKKKGRLHARYRTDRRGSWRTGFGPIAYPSTVPNSGQPTASNHPENRMLEASEIQDASYLNPGTKEDALKIHRIEEDPSPIPVPAPSCGSQRTARPTRRLWAADLEQRTTLRPGKWPSIEGIDQADVDRVFKAVSESACIPKMTDGDQLAVGNFTAAYGVDVVAEAAEIINHRRPKRNKLDYLVGIAKDNHAIGGALSREEKRSRRKKAEREEVEDGNGKTTDYSDVVLDD